MPTKLAAICVSMFYGANFGSGFIGIILAHLMLNVAFAFYIICLAYNNFDITLLWLASEAGASSWRSYKDIIFPLLRPTIISAFLLLFLLHFASFSIPLILGSSIIHNTPEISIYNFYSSGDNFSALITWALRLLVILPVFFLHSKHAQENIKISSVPVIYERKKISFFGKLFNNLFASFSQNSFRGVCKSLHEMGFFYLVYFIFLLIITVGPLIALLVKSCDKKVFDFFASVLSCNFDPRLGACVYRVILNSIILAVTSATGAVLVACLICVLEFKLKSKFSKNIISFITVLAFIIGSVGVGIIFAYFYDFSFFSPVLAWPFIIGLLAHVFLNYAFAYRIIRAQAILYHPDLTKTAQALGASYKKATFSVLVPFISPALIKAFCISFGLSLTEVGAGAILHGKIGLTIPMAIKIYRQVGCQEGVIGLSLVLLGQVLIVTYLFSRKNNYFA
jgi:ABC-type Fe3+ transport system, permease component